MTDSKHLAGVTGVTGLTDVPVPFADASLSKRLERTEGFACSQYAEARRRLDPGCGSTWMTHAGAYVVFDGVDSPVTQTFGLGLFEELSPATLDTIEPFFRSRGAHVDHEISPLVGVAALDLLCSRNYRPIEVSTVLFQPIKPLTAASATASAAAASADPAASASAVTKAATASLPDNVRVRVIDSAEAPLWADVSARGWSHEHPELEDFLRRHGAIATAREQSPAFLAEIDGTPGAAGVLCLHEGVALFGGAATVPELRRRGLQSALLQARMRYAAERGCDLAMMVAQPGSNSQRNAERAGFRIAYTRIKWRLAREGA